MPKFASRPIYKLPIIQQNPLRNWSHRRRFPTHALRHGNVRTPPARLFTQVSIWRKGSILLCHCDFNSGSKPLETCQHKVYRETIFGPLLWKSNNQQKRLVGRLLPFNVFPDLVRIWEQPRTRHIMDSTFHHSNSLGDDNGHDLILPTFRIVASICFYRRKAQETPSETARAGLLKTYLSHSEKWIQLNHNQIRSTNLEHRKWYEGFVLFFVST